MFSADAYVKGFIDQNWLTLAIFLFLLRGIATSFGVRWLGKLYQVLSSAYQFIRPGAIQADREATSPEKK